MKPYGRIKTVKGSGSWKKDYHLHTKKGRKLESWWEGICDHLSRSRMKEIWKKEVDNKD